MHYIATKALLKKIETGMSSDLYFEQIKKISDNFSYIAADEVSKKAVVIDPSYNADAIIQILKRNGFPLEFIINTHGHSDHTAGNSELKSFFNAKVVASKKSKISFDINVSDGDILKIGKVTIQVIYTPGHSMDSICLLINNEKLLTGDTLFVNECGRTDLPGGSSKDLFESLFNKLLKLNPNIEVYPGHDYGPKPFSTIAEEKESNYTLKPRNIESFIEFMSQP